MKFKTMLLTSAALVAAVPALAQDEPIQLTFVSWGGAYQNSQIKAYAEPYMAMHPNVTIIWDESSNEAVAKMRAMYEAGNVTWDLVDVEGPDSQRLCDEGLAMEVDFDSLLAPAPDGSPATADFGDSIINECFIPQIVFSTTFGYRTDVAEWEGRTPDSLCAIFDSNGRSCATVWPAKTCMTCCPPRKASNRRWPSSTPSRMRSCGGRPAPTRRSFWPMARSSWARPITVGCSR